MKKLFIIFAILCLAAPAMAADWNFYGSSRMTTFYTSVDKDAPAPNDDTINRTEWYLQKNSRIGANVKVNDQIGGRFEYGTGVNLRLLFGTYTFPDGSQLLIGQTYTPASQYFYSKSVFDGDGALKGLGQFYTGRLQMIQWRMGGLKIALVNPSTKVETTADAAIFDRTEVIIPKIELAYKFKADTFFADIYGGYNTFDIMEYDTGTGTKDVSVSSYVFGLGGGMNFNALYFNIGGHIGQNLGNYGSYHVKLGGLPAIDDYMNISATGEEKDNTSYGALAVIGFNISEMWTIEAGAGYMEAEDDIDGAEGENVIQVYLNTTANIAPGFFIVPEIGYATYDYEKDPTTGLDPNPKVLYVGAKWQINF
jgi:hypothetical protein